MTMLRNWLWLGGLVLWFALVALLILAGVMVVFAFPPAVTIASVLTAAPLAVSAAVGPVSRMLVSSAAAGSVFEPGPGSRWGLPGFERRVLLAREQIGARRTRRLRQWVRDRGLAEARRGTFLVGTLWQDDAYGRPLAVGPGMLVRGDRQLVFVAARWFGWRGTVVGASAPREELASTVTVGGDAHLDLRITRWSSATSLTADAVTFRAAELGVLSFVHELGSPPEPADPRRS